MEDCSPRNVVVDKESQAPFVIDFAQCNFKDKMIAMWEALPESSGEEGEEEDDSFDPELEYWDRVRGADNPGAIGSVMATRVRQEKGIDLEIQYPDIYSIIDDMKRRMQVE